jgi:cytidylate kinase
MLGNTAQTQSKRKIIIAIDGPSASGKSTTARGVAKKLGFRYIDTGAMYRAITVKVLDHGIDPNDSRAIADLLRDVNVQQQEGDNGPRFLLDGIDVTDRIRTPAVDQAIGPVCEVPEVRARMVMLQRQLGKGGGIVLEGRDIGTVVFPDAELKVFLVADIEERARRRMRQYAKRGSAPSIEFFEDTLKSRDYRDSQRQLSPLTRAEDARELDTTRLSVEDQISIIVGWAREIIDRTNENP